MPTLSNASRRGIRRIVQCLNMFLRVQAHDEQYLVTVRHDSLLCSNLYLTREVECVRLKQERFNAFDLLRGKLALF